METDVWSAGRVLAEKIQPVAVERIPLEEAWGRILAEPVVADRDFPPFDRSPLDGYAVLATDVSEAREQHPVRLMQLESVAAGVVPSFSVTTGMATRIMTGAALPPGATGVVRLEDVVVNGKEIKILDGQGVGKNICRRGEEFMAGEIAVQPGREINSGVMGLLAMFGYQTVGVYRQPIVALLATGSELLQLDEPWRPGCIRNSNSYMLAGGVRAAGGLPQLAGCRSDDADSIAAAIADVTADVIVTTGGVSVGDYDVMEQVFQLLEVPLLFKRVRMKPGMPVMAGWRDGQLLMALSGNPAAAAVAFERLVRPVIQQLAGRQEVQRRWGKARLHGGFEKASPVLRHVWGRFVNGKETSAPLLVECLSHQGNGMLRAAAEAEIMLIIPPGNQPLQAGDWVEFFWL